MMNSGKFVIRIDPQLHVLLKEQAKRAGLSLNQIVIQRLQNEVDQNFAVIQNQFGKELLGIILFGSTVRGDQRKSSDIDLLIVLKESTKLSRKLYSEWDDKVESQLGPQYSPQFVHLPKDLKQVSGLWLEAALEGEIVFEVGHDLRTTVYKIKDLISSGYFQRKESYGHPYWIRKEEQRAK